jgi:NitT/TauT family transport system substrate-binding protein
LLRHGTPTRKKSRPRRLAAAVVTAGLLVSTSGCGLLSGEEDTSEPQGGNGSVEKSTITVAHLPSIDVAPLYIAQEKGYFKEEGLNVKIEVAASGQAATQKMIGGDADIVQSSYVPFLLAHTGGAAELKIVADAVSAAPDTFVLIAKKGGSVKSIEDLEGKRVAVSAVKTISDTLVMSAMKSNGLDPENVEFVQTSFPDIASAVAKGRVDAGLVVEPFLTIGAEEHGVTPIGDVATGPTEDFPLAGYGALAEFVEKNPKTVAAFQRAMERATEDTQNREVIEPVIQETAGIDATTASLVNLPNFHAGLDASRLQRVPDLMVEFGLLKKKFDIKPMLVTPSTT